MCTASDERAAALNIRIKAPQRALIEQATQSSGKTVSDFVCEAALRAARNALHDRTAVELDEAERERFVATLDAPPSPNPRLRELLARKPAWGPTGRTPDAAEAPRPLAPGDDCTDFACGEPARVEAADCREVSSRSVLI